MKESRKKGEEIVVKFFFFLQILFVKVYISSITEKWSAFWNNLFGNFYFYPVLWNGGFNFYFCILRSLFLFSKYATNLKTNDDIPEEPK